MNKGTSVWDCMHMDNEAHGNLPPRPFYNKTLSAASKNNDSRNQRRDPIGYFEDTKFMTNEQQQQQQRPDSRYKPSWSDFNQNNVNNNDLVNNIDLMGNGHVYPSYPVYPEVAN